MARRSEKRRSRTRRIRESSLSSSLVQPEWICLPNRERARARGSEERVRRVTRKKRRRARRVRRGAHRREISADSFSASQSTARARRRQRAPRSKRSEEDRRLLRRGEIDKPRSVSNSPEPRVFEAEIH